MPAPLLDIRNLTVSFATRGATIEAVRGIDLSISSGETLAIVGESGSGKSQAMMAICGLLANNGAASGTLAFAGNAPGDISRAPLTGRLGREIALIFQEPMTSLDPLRRIGDQFTALIRRHGPLRGSQARARAAEMLELVQIPDPALRLRSYPHELSGGQRQRVMIAMALVHNPKLLIADEPTTALDVTVQAEIIGLLTDLQKRFGMAIIFISHDLNLVRRFARRIVVMRTGEVVEGGLTEAVFAKPHHAYTRMLIDAEPKGHKAPVAEDAPLLLEARNMHVQFAMPQRLFSPRVPDLIAVNGVSLLLRQGETLGIVGESGSGKSTLGKALLGLVGAKGEVTFNGLRIDTLSKRHMRPLRRNMQVVFQDPFGSLSPRMTVGEIIAEGLSVHEPRLSKHDRAARVSDVMQAVALPTDMRNRYPHEFSGGQRQRIAIARALILKPQLVLLDEPTSALDRTVQSSIIALLRELQEQYKLTYLFISHDLAVVRALADHVIVMKSGCAIETGSAQSIFNSPATPYTQALVRAAHLGSG